MPKTTFRPPRSIATSPRPWLTRQPGECAFPVAGEGMDLICCCNPSGPRAYCDGHASIARLRNVTSPRDYELEIIRFLEKRERRS